MLILLVKCNFLIFFNSSFIFRYEVEAFYSEVISEYSAKTVVVEVYSKIDPIFEFQPLNNKKADSKNLSCKYLSVKSSWNIISLKVVEVYSILIS